MSAMNTREMPITVATWLDGRWVISLPGGPREAADDREAVELIARYAPYSAIKWVLPILATEVVTEPEPMSA
jgi:hypothetical protein